MTSSSMLFSSFTYFPNSNQNTLALKWKMMNQGIKKKKKNSHFQLHQGQVQMTYLREMKSTFIPAVSMGGCVSQAHTQNYENEHVCGLIANFPS